VGVKNPKLLVIDADIAQSAGGEDAIYPVPKQCRDFLAEVLKTGHRMVMTPALYSEWKEHESNFTRSWRTQMVSRKQVQRFGYAGNDITDEDLRNDIEQHAPNPGACQYMLDDVHLVEAALAAGQRVASRDERVRGHFSRVSQQIIKLRPIVWVNPSIPEETCIKWLKQNAPPDDERKLGKEWGPS
jgi:hypothetical protein